MVVRASEKRERGFPEERTAIFKSDGQERPKTTMTFVEGPGKNRDWPCPTVGKRVPEGRHSTVRGSEERAGEGVGGQEKCPESGGDGRSSRS